jgi:Secretion system C-terminal sorting domain
MKRITLFVVMLTISITTFSQTNPCPDIQSHGFTPISSSGPNCTSKVYAYATGDISSQKSLQISVYVGSVAPANLVAEACHIVAANSASTYYETPSFTVSCTATIIYVLRRGTSSNGICGGGECGATFTVTGGPLPIKLTNFFAKRNTASVGLSWKTTSEINAKSFIIQRKTGNEFFDVATIAATNKANGSMYTYEDKNTNNSISQYRLKLVDMDGFIAFSEIRTVKGASGSVSDFIVFPNPSTGNAKVTVTDISESTDVQLLDYSGRILKNVSMNNKNTVDFNSLQSGMYLIRIVNKNSGETSTKKLNVLNK